MPRSETKPDVRHRNPTFYNIVENNSMRPDSISFVRHKSWKLAISMIYPTYPGANRCRFGQAFWVPGKQHVAQTSSSRGDDKTSRSKLAGVVVPSSSRLARHPGSITSPRAWLLRRLRRTPSNSQTVPHLGRKPRHTYEHTYVSKVKWTDVGMKF